MRRTFIPFLPLFPGMLLAAEKKGTYGAPYDRIWNACASVSKVKSTFTRSEKPAVRSPSRRD
jgi:hypothetical protein